MPVLTSPPVSNENPLTVEFLDEYLKKNLQNYIHPENRIDFTAHLDLVERVVRVEEEIKASIKLSETILHQMDKRFEQVDKRFEQVDRRFEQVDKRFEYLQKSIDSRFRTMQWTMSLGFTLVVALMSVFKVFS